MVKTPLLKWIEIERKALTANIRTVQGLLGPATKLMAVVKADAYGHGADEVARLALRGGADALGVLTLQEGLALRQKGLRGRIVLLSPPLPAEARAAVSAKLEPTVDSLALARALARSVRGKCPIHVDLDYGLARWGVRPKDLPEFLGRLRKFGKLRLAGISAHIDYVPGKNTVEAEDKLRDFSRRTSRIKAESPDLARHCANSSILLDFPHWHLDMARVGNLLYGINPTSRELALRNPWRLYARIISLKDVKKGTPIGYASEYLAPRKMRVAALPVGYSDGLTMEPAERFIGFGKAFRYWGWLKGGKVPLVGRSGISHILVDVSGVPRAKIGDPVALHVRRTAASAHLPRIYV